MTTSPSHKTHHVLRVPTQQFSAEQHRTVDAWGTSSRWCQPAHSRPHAPDAPAATVRTLQVLIWAKQHISRLFPANEHGPEVHWCMTTTYLHSNYVLFTVIYCWTWTFLGSWDIWTLGWHDIIITFPINMAKLLTNRNRAQMAYILGWSVLKCKP